MHHWTKTNYNKRGVRLSFKREFILFGCAIIALSGLTISAPTPGVAQATCQTCGKGNYPNGIHYLSVSQNIVATVAGGTSTDFTTIAVNRRGSSAAAHGIFFWPNGAYSFTLTVGENTKFIMGTNSAAGHSDGHISGITTNNAGGKPIKITVERNVEIGNRHNPIRDLSTDNDPGYGIFATILSGPSTSTLTIDNSAKIFASNNGIRARNLSQGTVSVTHAGLIQSESFGIWAASVGSGAGGDVTVTSTGTITATGIETNARDGANYMPGAIWTQIAKSQSSADVAISVTEGVLSSLGTLSQTVWAGNSGKGAVNITLGVDGGAGPRIRTLGEGIYAVLARHDPGTDAAASKSRIVMDFHSGDIDARYRGIGAWVPSHGKYQGVEDSPMVHIVSSGNINVGKAPAIEALKAMATALLNVDGEGALTSAEKELFDLIDAEATTEDKAVAFTTKLTAMITLDPNDNYNDVYEALATRIHGAAAQLRKASPRNTNYADKLFHGYFGVGITAWANSARRFSEVIDVADADVVEANRVGDNAIERRIFNAVITGADEAKIVELLDLLTDTAAYDDAYDNNVKALLERFNAGDIRIEIKGGSVISDGDGVVAGFGRFDDKNGGIQVSVAEEVVVTGNGEDRYGIDVWFAGLDNKGTADEASDDVRKQSVTVDGTVTGGEGGVRLNGGGTVTVGAPGTITGAKFGVIITDRLDDENLFGLGSGNVKVENSGAIEATAGTGILIRRSGVGSATVDVLPESTVSGSAYGISIEGTTTRDENVLAQTVTVDGTVSGGIKLVGGGTVIIGATGTVMAEDGTAILVEDATVEGKTVNRLVLQVTRGEALLSERIVGRITNPGGKENTKIYIRPTDDDEYQLFVVGESQTLGKYDITVLQNGNHFTFSEELASLFSGELGYVLSGGSEIRAQVFEAVPSMLLSLNGLTDLNPSRSEMGSGGMSSKGNSIGDMGAEAWFDVEFASGSWKAETSTFGSLTGHANTEYDLKRQGFKAGVDVPTGDDFVVGVSLHHNRSTAKFKNDAGSAKMTGQGLGVSGIYFADSFYIGAQVAFTKYKADLTGESNTSIVSGASGSGHSMGIEAGLPLRSNGMTFTPRAAIERTTAQLDDFTSTGGVAFSMPKESKTTARVGVRTDLQFQSGSFFAAMDLEHDFSNDGQSVKLVDTKFTSKGESTRLRLGLGGSIALAADGQSKAFGSLGYSSGGGNELSASFGVKLVF